MLLSSILFIDCSDLLGFEATSAEIDSIKHTLVLLDRKVVRIYYIVK